MRKKNAVTVMLVELFCVLAGIVALLVFTGDWGLFFQQYVDLPALALIALLVLPVFVYSGCGKDFLRVFHFGKPDTVWKLSELKHTLEAVELLQKQLVYSGVLIILFQTVGVLYRMFELSTVGPILAMMMRSGFYVAVLELLLMPLSVEIKRLIIDFMEEEPE